MLTFLLSVSVFATAAHSFAHHRCAVLKLVLFEATNIVAAIKMSQRPNLKQYLVKRQHVLDNEYSSSFESDVQLTDKELLANEIIMDAKNYELNEAHKDPYSFRPARHFFEISETLNDSRLHRILQKMPKGGILHAHDMAICCLDYMVSLTYREHLWQCKNRTTGHIVNFLFSRKSPATSDTAANLVWTKVVDERTRMGNADYDKIIRRIFSLRRKQPQKKYKDINAVWDTFAQMFILFLPIITYAPVWEDYYRQTLIECHDDGVQYLEFRGILPTVSLCVRALSHIFFNLDHLC